MTVAGGVYTLTTSRGDWKRFDSAGLLTATGNRFGDSTRFVYALGSDILASIIDEAGAATNFTYAPNGICPGGSASGSLCAITDVGGRVTKLIVDGSNDLVAIYDPAGTNVFSGTYSGHRLTSYTDRLGSSTTLTYDVFTGLATATAQAITTTTTGGSTATESPVTTYQSIESAVLGASNSSSGSALASVPANAGLARVIAPNGGVTAIYPQGPGLPTTVSVSPVAGPIQATNFEYNSNYLPISITQLPVGGTTQYEWGGRDTLLAVIDPTGARTDFFYSPYFLLPDSITLNGAQQEYNIYSGSPVNLATSYRAGAPTTYSWDSHGRMTQQVTAGWTTRLTYVSSGAFQNRDSVIIGGYATKFLHDAFGRDSIVENPYHHLTTTSYDLLNRVTNVTQAGPAVTSTGISENTGAHTTTVTVTDPRSLTFTSASNALGWTTTVTDPQSNTAAFGYDRNGFLRRSVDRAGGVVTASYDSLGRPVSIIANGYTTSFSYDAAASYGDHWSVSATAESRDSVALDYKGRPSTTTTTRGGLTFTLTNTYNAQGNRNLLKVSTPGLTDSLHFVTDNNSFPFQLPDFGQQWSYIHYDLNRQVDTLRFTTGTSSTRLRLLPQGYNMFGRPETLTVKRGSFVEDRWRYSYDALGRLTRADSGDVERDFYTRWYTYDARGRLYDYKDTRTFISDSIPEDCPGVLCEEVIWTPVWTEDVLRSTTYAPDYSGNRTDGSASLTYDRLGSMTGADGIAYSFSYDNEGRRTAKTASGYSQTYGWNDFNQLTWVKTNADSVAYGYDGAGRRVRKYASATGNTTYYLWEGDNLLMEVDAVGSRLRQYTYQAGIDRPVAMTAGGTTYYYILDEEGNVRAVWSAANARSATYEYDPYGYLVDSYQALNQPLRWKGREFDDETGLYYMRARYYDPAVGRFISEDPIGLAGGINPHAFADGDPVNHSDPSGLQQAPRKLPGITTTAPAPRGPRGPVGVRDDPFTHRDPDFIAAFEDPKFAEARRLATDFVAEARLACRNTILAGTGVAATDLTGARIIYGAIGKLFEKRALYNFSKDFHYSVPNWIVAANRADFSTAGTTVARLHAMSLVQGKAYSSSIKGEVTLGWGDVGDLFSPPIIPTIVSVYHIYEDCFKF